MRADLEAAFRATDYEVMLPFGREVLRVDQPSTALAEWLSVVGQCEFAVLTAWNPDAKWQDEAENRAANRALGAALSDQGYVCRPGCNHAAGDWPVEESWLVAGLSLAHAREIGAKYGQVAILHGGSDGVPRLIWIRQREK